MTNSSVAPASAAVHLDLASVAINYAEQRVVDGVSLALERGERVALLGPSGSGKTSVLRAIAGFERVSDGQISLRGQIVSDRTRHLAPEQRRIAYAFQDPSLFPHLTARGNIGFGIRSSDAAQIVTTLARELEVSDQLDAFPHQMSGGQQQRVALARALATARDTLLLDEPFSSLDRGLRAQLSRHLADLAARQQLTAVLVTHDIDEALAFADRIAVLVAGRLVQCAPPQTLLTAPVNPEVAALIGPGALLHGIGRGTAVDTAIGPVDVEGAATASGPTSVWLRPTDIELDPAGETEATVRRVRPTTRGLDHELSASGCTLHALWPTPQSEGARVRVRLRASVPPFAQEPSEP